MSRVLLVVQHALVHVGRPTSRDDGTSVWQMMTPNASYASKEETELDAAVFGTLERWAGFAGLTQAMERLPALDVYVVGGTIRDLFLRRTFPRKDFDFVIRGEGVDEFLGLLAEGGPVSRNPFGLPRWTPTGAEIYADILPVSLFNTGLTACLDIDDVLQQFDFTANALAYDIRRRRLYDPIGGKQDALHFMMRGVRFDYSDDPIAPGVGLTRRGVIWIRIMHYATKLGFDIEPNTLGWLRANRNYISQRHEFSQILFVPNLELVRRL